MRRGVLRLQSRGFQQMGLDVVQPLGSPRGAGDIIVEFRLARQDAQGRG